MPAGLDRLDLNLLRAFLAIYDGAGVSAAAARLHRSQPAVSNALARLREHLGDPLFERRGGGFVPTPEARRLEPTVRQALDLLAKGISEPERFDPARAQRRFRIAMTDAGAMVFLPAVARMLARQGGQLGIEVRPFGSVSLADALGSGAIDGAIGPPADDSDGLRTEQLFVERYVGLIRRGGRLARELAKGAALTPTQWSKAPLVVVDQPMTHHRVIPQALAARGLSGHIVAVVPNFADAMPLVEAFDAVVLVPSQVGQLYAQRGTVTCVEVPMRLARFRICWVTHPRFERDAGLRWFGERVCEVVPGPVP